MSILKRKFKFTKGDSDSPLSGYAFKFSETAEGFYGKERFSPDLKLVLNKRCFLLRDHSYQRILGKTDKNLEIKTDDQGLFFRVTKPIDTDLFKETVLLCKERLLDGASVGFRSITEVIEKSVRIFKKIELYEISLTPIPYYESSEVEARSKDKIILPPEVF